MIPRFPTPVEQRYLQAFPERQLPVTAYADICEAAGYEALLQQAIDRGAEVTLEELTALSGEEAFQEHSAYLQEWGTPHA